MGPPRTVPAFTSRVRVEVAGVCGWREESLGWSGRGPNHEEHEDHEGGGGRAGQASNAEEPRARAEWDFNAEAQRGRGEGGRRSGVVRGGPGLEGNRSTPRREEARAQREATREGWRRWR